MIFQLYVPLVRFIKFLISCLLFSPLSRQDLVSWKMALDKRQLPEVDRNVRNRKYFYRLELYVFYLDISCL